MEYKKGIQNNIISYGLTSEKLMNSESNFA